MGRPSKLTKRVADKICLALRSGVTMEAAASFAGIDRATLYRWLERGLDGRGGRYREFRTDVEKAQGEVEARICARIIKAVDEGDHELGLKFLRFRSDVRSRSRLGAMDDAASANKPRMLFELPPLEPETPKEAAPKKAAPKKTREDG
jgi:hypothetical protein